MPAHRHPHTGRIVSRKAKSCWCGKPPEYHLHFPAQDCSAIMLRTEGRPCASPGEHHVFTPPSLRARLLRDSRRP